jgi:hypothetical protein
MFHCLFKIKNKKTPFFSSLLQITAPLATVQTIYKGLPGASLAGRL